MLEGIHVGKHRIHEEEEDYLQKLEVSKFLNAKCRWGEGRVTNRGCTLLFQIRFKAILFSSSNSPDPYFNISDSTSIKH